MPPLSRALTIALVLAGVTPALHAQQEQVPREEESRRPRDRGRKSPKPTQPKPPKAQRPQLLLTTDLACEVSIDFKKAVTLTAGGHATIDVEPGEHLVTAVTPDGVTWQAKESVSTGQKVVQIVLAGAAAPTGPADFDAAWAAVVAAMADTRGAGNYVAWVLEKKAFGHHDVELTVSLQRAATRLARARNRARALKAPDAARGRAATELARAAEETAQLARLLTEAATVAQQENTSLGKAAQIRAQALAHVPLMALDAASLAAFHASNAFRSALPRDRWPDAGLELDPQDVRLGADYDGDAPLRLGEVPKGSLADALGLRGGDRVVSVDGRPVRDGWELKQALRAAAGKTATLEVVRDGKRVVRKAKVPAALPR